MKNTLIIIGAGGHGKVVADIALKMNKWEEIYFLDNNDSLEFVLGIKVIGRTSDYKKYISHSDMFVAIGDNKVREKIMEEMEGFGVSIPILIHQSTNIGIGVNINIGTVLMAGAIVNSDTMIGKGCIINTGVNIDHETIISNYSHISPGANLAGNVHIGYRTWVGIGCTISNNINITKDCIIGAGSLVIKNINESGIYFGSPTNKIQE